MKLLQLIGAVSLLNLAAMPAMAQPSLTHAVPSAIAPGTTSQVTIHGAKLDEPLSVWTSFPCNLEFVPPADGKKVNNQIVCKVTLEKDARVGVCGIIVGTKAASSNTLFVMIDDLATVADNGKCQNLAAGQVVPLPTAVDGISQAGTSDFYRFTAKAGQRVTCESVARRMGSAMDTVMWLRDAEGRELAYIDDDPSLGADCRIAYEFTADGEYVLEIRDNTYQAGRRYRLRIGDFPAVTSAFPLGVQTGSTSKLGFVCTAASQVPQIDVNLPPETPQGLRNVAAKFAGGQTSGFATVVVSDIPESVEAEPNNAADAATKIQAPGAVSGRIETPGDRDFYRFAAKKGQRFVFRSLSRSLGSPTYVFMRLLKADGGKLAETGVNGLGEESFVHTMPADGEYLLTVEDLLHRSGPTFTYRVDIQPPRPFTLSLKSDKTGRYQHTCGKNAAIAIDVVCKRDGYNGPITLGVQSPREGFKVYNNVIAEKQAAGKLLVDLPDDAKEGDLDVVKITGTATVNGMQITATTDSAALMKTKIPLLPTVPDWHDGLVAIATGGDAAEFYTLVAEGDAVTFTRGTEQTQFNLKLERKNKEFKAALIVKVEGQPEGVTAAVKQEGKPPKDTYQITLKGPKDLPAGEHKIKITAFGEMKGQYQKTTIEVPLKIVEPSS